MEEGNKVEHHQVEKAEDEEGLEAEGDFGLGEVQEPDVVFDTGRRRRNVAEGSMIRVQGSREQGDDRIVQGVHHDVGVAAHFDVP